MIDRTGPFNTERDPASKNYSNSFFYIINTKERHKLKVRNALYVTNCSRLLPIKILKKKTEFS